MYRIRAAVALIAIGVFLSSVSASHPISASRLASASPFKLPVPTGVYVIVTQGNNLPSPDWDHNGSSAYAFDFALLTSTNNFVVTAAQGGTVIGVDDSSTLRCDGPYHEADTPADMTFPGCWTHGNYVLIADDDGTTAALYLHLLTHSAKVRVGYHVKQGQQLALADTTGFAIGNPHLHFQAEEIPTQAAQKNKAAGWWFTQSVPITFSNQEVLAKRPDGVPLTYDSFCLGNTTCSSAHPAAILPGGLWTTPSPKDRQTVFDIIHFAAHAYPTHSGDPAIAQVNCTVGSQGTWKVACTATPPTTGNTFACDVNLKNLGVSYGQIQVSFDVYDQAGNINLSPNGVHTLTNMPTPQPVPTPTPSPTPQPKLTTVNVSATQGWQDTGVLAHTGDKVTIRYISGLWTSQSGVFAPFDGTGQPDGYICANIEPASQCVEPVPDAIKGSLVGKIGTDTFEVGDYLQFNPTQGGTLYLRMNDADVGLHDNQGSITVQIEVS